MQLRTTITADSVAKWFGADDLIRVPTSALPDDLVHEPTRRFLSEVGLPREGGAYVRLHTDPAVWLRPVSGRLEQPTAGADHLLVLGECGGHPPIFGDWLVLDSVTGQVFIVDGRCSAGSELVTDLVASDLSVLVTFVHELEALRATAADPTAHDGRRGRDVMTEVTRAVCERMQATDPAVFTQYSDAPHWTAVLAGYGLLWAARRNHDAAESLAFDITPELMEDLVMLPVSPEDLPPTLRHEPTRRLLTTVGLPTSGYLRDSEARPLVTLRDSGSWQADDDGEPHCPAQRDLIRLGAAGQDYEILLDGATGRIEAVEGEDLEDCASDLLHTDLSAFYLAIWTLTRLAELWDAMQNEDEDFDDYEDDYKDEFKLDPYNPGPTDWNAFFGKFTLERIALDLLAQLDAPSVAHDDTLWNVCANDSNYGYLLG
ncbi:SUKH-4 family immunity protein [Kitasatospora cathayae]|uniref:SUKH-4 family immunity protein n=1 Tax=Kitasatospora cathayae TaxID=3004092 RepID=A0ABY7PWX4_9ACTN|nr:SUKH-4 family immunity protein [Kitasatospora sp. HUAS 3-15]WBP84684.1 SUKH-4 family immunity protein [Kitasatospora sp. HUAS 3-15]